MRTAATRTFRLPGAFPTWPRKPRPWIAPALEYAIDGDSTLRRLEASLVEAEAAHDGHKIGELHAALHDADAYTVRARAEQLLNGLGFSRDQMNRPVASFSGGWRMRLNLAQALMCPSDLLLLDEPTNHLDLDAILWLEDWLKRYAGTLIIISHDRDFLDGVVNVIVHIDERKLKRYGGNYSSFEKQRAINLALSQAAFEKQSRERDHLQSFIDRFKAKASKAKQAQSRMKMLAKMEDLAPIHASAAFSFEFREPDRAPNPLLVLEEWWRVIPPPPREEGQGEGQCTGGRGWGRGSENHPLRHQPQPPGRPAHRPPGRQRRRQVHPDQDHRRRIAATGRRGPLGQGPGHRLLRPAPGGNAAPRPDAPLAPGAHRPDGAGTGTAQLPGRLQLRRRNGHRRHRPFSGGEKARLALALIVWQKPNLLLLDEPTNHLDLETREALTVALAQFEGTLVLVSHDRHLLRATTDEFLIVADGGLKPFDGDLDDYRDWLFKTKLAKPDAAPAPSQTRPDNRSLPGKAATARNRSARKPKPASACLPSASPSRPASSAWKP
jgi:ATP-binding cassette subfamily F protein 3